MKEAAIAVIYSEDKKKILLVKRRDVPVWVLPGGGIDSGETPEDAAVRELYEETGVIGHSPHLLIIYTPINRIASKTHLIELLYKSGSPRAQVETADARFFPLNALPDSFFFIHKEWLAEIQNTPTFPIEKKMNSVTWKRLFLSILTNPILLLRAVASRFGLPINQ